MPTIRPRGEGFQAIVRVKRLGTIVHQESRMFTTERLARDWGERLEKKIKTEGIPERKLSNKTLGALLEDYLEQLRTHNAVHRARENELLQLASVFDKTYLNNLTAHTFTQFAQRRKEIGTGPTTILHNLATVRAVLNAAKPMFGLDVNGQTVSEAISALGRVGAVTKSASRERRPTTEELQALDAEYRRIATYPSTKLPMVTLVPLAIEFPRRLGELLKMKWSDYDKKAGIMTLRGTKHPTRARDEIVPVSREARRIIDALPVLDERILPYEPESVSTSFQRITERLGLKDLRFHDLRHEGISRMFERGLSIHEVAIVSGHQSWAMLRRYTHPSVTALAEKLNAGEQET